MRAFSFSLGVLLLAWTTKAGEFNVKAEKDGEGVKLTCVNGDTWRINGVPQDKNDFKSPWTLEYDDANSGRYECFKESESESEVDTFYVKFRTCKNCIELDWLAMVGIIMGNIVATILIGIAVYFISIQSKGPSFPSNKTSQESDRRNLIPNDSTYQTLTGGRDAYDVLHTRRR